MVGIAKDINNSVIILGRGYLKIDIVIIYHKDQ